MGTIVFGEQQDPYSAGGQIYVGPRNGGACDALRSLNRAPPHAFVDFQDHHPRTCWVIREVLASAAAGQANSSILLDLESGWRRKSTAPRGGQARNRVFIGLCPVGLRGQEDRGPSGTPARSGASGSRDGASSAHLTRRSSGPPTCGRRCRPGGSTGEGRRTTRPDRGRPTGVARLTGPADGFGPERGAVWWPRSWCGLHCGGSATQLSGCPPNRVNSRTIQPAERRNPQRALGIRPIAP